MKNEMLKPFVKWVGGKRQLLPAIMDEVKRAKGYSAYYEPFLGGGATLLAEQPRNAIVNDYNSELINAYCVIRDDVESLINLLSTYPNESEFFYEIRAFDRKPEFKEATSVEKAARMIYLNKTCYNGLYRVNKSGYFNTPFGKYKNPKILDEEGLRALNNYFNQSQIKFITGDFEDAVASAVSGDLVYFDPPYAPLSETANFTSYTDAGFDEFDQRRLANLCHELDQRGVKFILSNSNVPLINELYQDFNIKIVHAKRNVNSKANKRGSVEEVLVTNY